MKYWDSDELSDDIYDFCNDLCSIRTSGSGSCCLTHSENCPLLEFKRKIVSNDD